MRKLLKTVLLLLFTAGAVFSIYQIIGILREYRAGDELYNDVQQHVIIHPEPTNNATIAPTEAKPPVESDQTGGGDSQVIDPTQIPETEPTIPKPELVFPVVDFECLLEISQDVVGWIYIEDTNINYPVVQGKDNRFYVSSMIDGTPNGAGSIFMDYRNASDISDPHLILYGHNMKNQSMFHDISNYRDQEYYDAHPIGMFITPEKNYYFEIVSAYVASLADPAWQLEFVDDADAHQWLLDSMKKAKFVTAAQPQPGDQMITLSTCSYEFSNARFVLVGILREY